MHPEGVRHESRKYFFVGKTGSSQSSGNFVAPLQGAEVDIGEVNRGRRAKNALCPRLFSSTPSASKPNQRFSPSPHPRVAVSLMFWSRLCRAVLLTLNFFLSREDSTVKMGLTPFTFTSTSTTTTTSRSTTNDSLDHQLESDHLGQHRNNTLIELAPFL